MHITLEWRSG